jgi:hypothetical protein
MIQTCLSNVGSEPLFISLGYKGKPRRDKKKTHNNKDFDKQLDRQRSRWPRRKNRGQG